MIGATAGTTTPRRLAGVAAALGLLALVAGCTGSDGGSSSSSFANGTAGQASASSAAGGATAAAAPAGKVPAADQATSTAASAALILTGSMTLTVRSSGLVGSAATRATGIADAAGGRVDADSRSSGTNRSATLVLRVPNAALPGVTQQLAALGTVRSQDLSTRDVTTQVADVNSRVTSARAAIVALTRLYAKAATVRDLITVEASLATRESNLEWLKAQQRSLAAQTSLATLTLSIDVRAVAAVKHHARSGFVGGLHSGWHAFTSTVRAMATGLGAVLPFAVVLLLIATAGAFAVRRRRRA